MVAPHTAERIDRILAYIDNNLDQDLSLKKIASIGCYSSFHLHRLFKAVTGETLNNYIIRKRIEKIAYNLMFRREITVTELSVQFGFSSNSSLTRAFTNFYGVSPTKFKRLQLGEYSKICKPVSKIGQASAIFEEYVCNIDNCLNYVKMNATIDIKELPQTNVAYTTCIGVAGLDSAFEKILQWGRRKQLTQHPDLRLIRIFHDSFRITEPEKVRMSIGIPVPETTEVSGDVALTAIEKGKFIVGRFLIEPVDFGRSWESLFVWMNETGYNKAEGNVFEFLHNNYNEHPEKKMHCRSMYPHQVNQHFVSRGKITFRSTVLRRGCVRRAPSS